MDTTENRVTFKVTRTIHPLRLAGLKTALHIAEAAVEDLEDVDIPNVDGVDPEEAIETTLTAVLALIDEARFRLERLAKATA